MALTQITKSGITADAIDATKIADNAVDSEHIAADSIDAEHYAAGSVDATALGADAVTAAKIGDDVIESEHYAATSIDNEHLADDAVGVAELSASGTASSSTFLRGDNSWVAAGGATITEGTWSASGTGGSDNQTAWHSSSNITVDANKAGTFSFTGTYAGAESPGQDTFGGMRAQIGGSTFGTEVRDDIITSGTRRGVSYMAGSFSSSGSSRSINVQVGQRGVGGAPGGCESIGQYQLFYT